MSDSTPEQSGSAELRAPPPVILVDEQDRPLGFCAKQDAHVRGLLHRAVSVLVVDAQDRTLLQRRALGKYHSGGLWSNAACTHPRQGESIEEAARRALREELGLEPESLTYAFPFVYRADVGDGLTEHEFDHVFYASVRGEPVPNALEVSEVAWAPWAKVAAEAHAHPERFTAWFRLLAEHRLRLAGLGLPT